jgi:hypothetical protein
MRDSFKVQLEEEKLKFEIAEKKWKLEIENLNGSFFSYKVRLQSSEPPNI